MAIVLTSCMSILSHKYTIIVAAIAVLTGCSGTSPVDTKLPTPITTVTPTSSPVVMSDVIGTEKAQVTTKDMMRPTQTVTPVAQVSPVYQNYTPELYTSLKGKKAFVLFFHAPWCHICKRMDQEIITSLASFPQGTIILKADYDTETALKKIWGIQVQSSIVVLNAQGESVFKGTDPGIAKMKENIAQSLQ